MVSLEWLWIVGIDIDPVPNSLLFRNWHWDAPSCGEGRCVVMSHRHLALPHRGGHFLFRWYDDNCNLKNNFVCKYSEGELWNTLELSGTFRRTHTVNLETSLQNS